MKKTMMVVACNGMLGHVMAEVASEKYNVVGTYTTFVSERSYPTERMDILNASHVKSLITKIKPDVVVNCSGIVDVEFCEERPDIAEAVHVDGTRNLVEACKLVGAKMVYISTDAVFDGVSGNYTEESKPNPINQYARTKLAGEKAMRDTDIVIRTSIYGWKIAGPLGFVEDIVDKLSNGKMYGAFEDYYFTPVYTGTLAETVIDMLKANAAGLYHVCPEEKMTKYTFAKKVADAFGLEKSLIQPSSVKSIKSAVKRPSNVALVSKRIHFGTPLISVDRDLMRMRMDTNKFGRDSIFTQPRKSK